MTNVIGKSGKSPISVLLATYNGEDYIREQLQSILRQTITPLEIIVKDDGSKDRTVEIVSEVAHNCSIPIKVHINADNMGYSQNFMEGVSLCSGEFVSFCDQDDIWKENKLEVSLIKILEHEADLCVHTADMIESSGECMGRVFQNEIKGNKFFGRNTFPLSPWRTYAGFSMLFRRSLAGIIDINERGVSYINKSDYLPHDAWIYFLASTFGTIVTIDLPLVYYRQHRKNTSGSLPYTWRSRFSRHSGEAWHPSRPRACIAHQRSSMLYKISAKLAKEAPLLIISANYWREVYEFEVDRERLYLERSLIKRFAIFGALIFGRRYLEKRPLSSSIGLVLKDFVVGVLRTRSLK